MNVTIGIVQKAAAHLDLAASVAQIESYVIEAQKQGVRLLVFGEGWLSGYPGIWFDYVPEAALWDYQPTKEVFARFVANSLSMDGPELKQIAALARKYQLILCIGFNERIEQGANNGTIFNSLVIIDSTGEIANHHRKLMPTFTERLVHGLGDAKGLKAATTSIGKVGSLICWEHWMPLTRQAMHLEGEHIHVALWPTVHEMHQVASRHYAFEGRCFVVAAGQLMQAQELPKEFTLPTALAEKPETLVLKGGSCIVAPNGRYIVEPDFTGKELVVGEVDLTEVTKEKMALDVVGHYNRPDVFSFSVNR
ncbi:MAG: carbon-nitrogen hydrolase family protein [Flammeovirgaceae bacterium]